MKGTTGLRTKRGSNLSQCPIGDQILVPWGESSHLYSSFFKKKKFKDSTKPVYMLCRINKCNHFVIIASDLLLYIVSKFQVLYFVASTIFSPFLWATTVLNLVWF